MDLHFFSLEEGRIKISEFPFALLKLAHELIRDRRLLAAELCFLLAGVWRCGRECGRRLITLLTLIPSYMKLPSEDDLERRPEQVHETVASRNRRAG
jgi:hypothetical protein